MLDRTQKQIMQSWKGGESCLVSIICAAYNHELYIRDAIESFLMQETDFPFEIIIHDDASTDDTPIIINEYYSCYPDIIRPIFQDENQYSKGKFRPSYYATGFSTSIYIALCEGDDYWINKRKLQIQVDTMQEHPEVDFCFHSAYCLRNGERDAKPSWVYNYDRIFSLDAVIESVDSFAPTPSYMLRRDVIANMPDWFIHIAPVGDYFFEIYGAKNGGAIYINQPMSVYRVNAVGSWSSKYIVGSMFHLQHSLKMLESLSLLKNELPEFADNMKIEEAMHLYYIAIFHLLDENDPMFVKYIEDSFAHHPFVINKQGILYKLRIFPSLLRNLIKLRNFALSSNATG